MSKNIDEIVDGVIPQDINKFLTIQEKASWKAARMLLKQSLTEKKLVVPMNELEIFTNLKTTYFDNSEMTGDQLWLSLAKAIYERQF